MKSRQMYASDSERTNFLRVNFVFSHSTTHPTLQACRVLRRPPLMLAGLPSAVSPPLVMMHMRRLFGHLCPSPKTCRRGWRNESDNGATCATAADAVAQLLCRSASRRAQPRDFLEFQQDSSDGFSQFSSDSSDRFEADSQCTVC